MKPSIIKALKLAYSYLRRSKLRQSVELSRSILKKPRIHEVSSLLENLFEEFRTLHDLWVWAIALHGRVLVPLGTDGLISWLVSPQSH
jgi:hypothetical protein